MNPSPEDIIEWLPATPEEYLWEVKTNPFGTKLYLKRKVRIFFGLFEIQESAGSEYLVPEVAGWKFTVSLAADRLLSVAKYQVNLNLKVEKH